MIILNTIKSNTSFKEILKIYKDLINLPYLECPYCESTELISWGSYTRNINYIHNNTILYETINIKRVRCKNCGHTHALIPSFIVPYKVNALDTILACISFDNSTLSLSFDTISLINKQFNKFLPYLKTMFNNIDKFQIICELKQNIFKRYLQFYNLNKKILMMTHYGILNMAYF